MAVKTRAELIAQNTATFGNGKNTRGDDEKAFNLNHLDSFLNKKGDTLSAGGYVAVPNGSKLKEGTNGGIALECATAYDFQWKEGVAYYRPTGGNIVYAMSAIDQIPNTGFDSTLFYAVGSRFVNLVTNVQYICTDASVGAATWSVVTSGGGVTSVSVATSNGLAGTSSGGATPTLTLSTTVTGLLKGNGTIISGATSGTDYAPATSGTSILYGDGAGGFSNVTIGTGLSFSTGTLSNTGIISLNGLTASTQLFATPGTSGTAPAWTSTTATHTLNIPLASASSVTAGLISKTDYDSFAGKQSALSGTGYSKWSGSTPSYLTPTQVTADLNLFSSSLQGLAPASGGGTTNFLRADGTWAAPGGGGSGTVNSGTQYQLAYYATTGTAVSGLTTGTSGQVLALSAGLIPTWTTLSTSTTLTNIGAATTSATLANANSTITWNWNSNTTANAFVLGSTGITSGNLLTLGISGSTATSADNLVITNSSTANTSGRGLDISITGATASGITYGAFISNTKTGATSTNTALSLTASGGTTNYALDVAAGISRFAAGTASTPQLILTPSTAAGGTTFTGTVNGSLWFDTNSTGTANSSLTLYKDTAYTKILTTARNPDFATGSASGVLIADTSGNITKSADLTALGIYAQTNDVPVVNTTTPTTLVGTVVGSATLPANFFAVGKTIIIFISGTYQQTNGSNTCTLNFSIGGVSIGSIALSHNNTLSTSYFEARVVVTCRTAGATGTVQYQGCGLLNLTGTPSFYYQTSTTSGSINTTTTNAINVTATWSAADASNSLIAGIHTAQYIN